jgi:hypothetical protein
MLNRNSFLPSMGIFFLLMIAPHCSRNVTPITNYHPSLNSVIKTLHKVDDYPLYTMEYEADYGFVDYLQSGNYPQLSMDQPAVRAKDSKGCTCFSAMGNEDSRILGRNFDWHDCVPLVLFTRPPDGYAAVSLVDLEYLGFHRWNLPDEAENQQQLLYTPYLPFDGMNEKGVAVGMMAIPSARGPYDENRVTIGELEVIRLILDYAASVEEALQLMQSYNIQFTDPPIHYMIADRSGHSLIVEFIDGNIYTLASRDSFHISTNFIIHGSQAPANTPCWRYNRAYQLLSVANGIVNHEEGMALLSQVSQSNTIWSTVYDMRSGEIYLALGRNYSAALFFQLPL